MEDKACHRKSVTLNVRERSYKTMWKKGNGEDRTAIFILINPTLPEYTSHTLCKLIRQFSRPGIIPVTSYFRIHVALFLRCYCMLSSLFLHVGGMYTLVLPISSDSSSSSRLCASSRGRSRLVSRISPRVRMRVRMRV